MKESNGNGDSKNKALENTIHAVHRVAKKREQRGGSAKKYLSHLSEETYKESPDMRSSIKSIRRQLEK